MTAAIRVICRHLALTGSLFAPGGDGTRLHCAAHGVCRVRHAHPASIACMLFSVRTAHPTIVHWINQGFPAFKKTRPRDSVAPKRLLCCELLAGGLLAAIRAGDGALANKSVGCAMRTMLQQLATSFRCARRTLHWFIELIRASLHLRKRGCRFCLHFITLLIYWLSSPGQ